MARGFFGVVIYEPKMECNVGTLWRAAFLNDAAFVGTVGARYRRQASDTPNTTNHVPLLHYSDFSDLRQHLPANCPLVAVELDPCSKLLTEFSHPERAVYLLGAEDRGIPPEVLELCDYIVEIPTVQPWSMNVAAAGSVVMYDRLAKRAVAS
jgi:tRNA(Leu) C34 or U34 (ribose-2'-O)-methylase TrmL